MLTVKAADQMAINSAEKDNAPRWAINLPKAHLHLHLVAACPRWLYDQFGSHLDPVFEGDCSGDFGLFERHHRAVSAIIKDNCSPTQLLRAVTRQAVAEGTHWLELHTNPDHLGSWANLEQVLNAAHPQSHGTQVGVGIIIQASREEPHRAVELALQAAKYRDQGVVGFGVAGNPAAAPLTSFVDAMTVAAEAGLKVVPHAGEFDRDRAEVWTAVDAGAHRVGHGVAAVSDPALIARLIQRRICLDVAYSSNHSMNTTGRGKNHPISNLVEAGVLCSVNTDNTTLVGHSLATEYARLRQELGLDYERIGELARNGWIASAAPSWIRQTALRGIDRWCQLRADL